MAKLSQFGSLVVPQHYIDGQGVSQSFVKQMQSIFGKDLHASWHAKKRRFIIEQCVEHYRTTAVNADGVVIHDHTCRRSYVWLVRDEATDEFMPLGDRVIQKLHEMETYRQFGTGPEALKRFQAWSAATDQEQAAKKKEEAHGTFQYLRRHNRIIRNKLKILMGRHDWLRPNK